MEAKDRILVALDVSTAVEAIRLMEQLAGHVGGFKIGLELIAAGEVSRVMSVARNMQVRIFYDAKFNDIPNTVARAANAIAGQGVWMFNVHASSGVKAMKAAVDHRGASLVLAVTVLTSLSDDQGVERIFHTQASQKVLEFAHDAEQAGCNGVICSPHELGELNQYTNFRSLLKVVPGIRPLWACTDDQVRVATPAAAIAQGADYVVIGRPITNPPPKIGSSLNAVKKITEEIEEEISV